MKNLRYIILLEEIDQFASRNVYKLTNKNRNGCVSIRSIQVDSQKLKNTIDATFVAGDISSEQHTTLHMKIEGVLADVSCRSRQSSIFPPVRRSQPNSALKRRLVYGAYAELFKKFHITPSVQSVMRAIEIESIKRGVCTLSVKEIGDLTGLGRSTVQLAFRILTAENLINVETRRQRKAANLTNVIRIISSGWLSLINSASGIANLVSGFFGYKRQGGGLKKSSCLLDSKYILEAFYREMAKTFAYSTLSRIFKRI